MRIFFKKILKIFFLYPVCFFILFVIYLLRPIILIRIGALSSWRMGHLAHDLEIQLAYKKQMKLKSFDIYVNTHLVANNFLKKKWEEKLTFINPKIGFHLVVLNNFFSKFYKKFDDHDIKFNPYDGDGLLEDDQTQQIFLTKKEIKKGWEILSKIGINENAKIACLDVRDDAYLKSRFPNKNWNYNDYRDCDIQNFISLTKYLNEKGYYVFRMGREVNLKMNYQNPKYFEYCLSDIKNDFLDIFIASICEFVISTGTGWAAVPTFNFRKPALYCNCLPAGELLTHSKKIMVSPKIHYSKKLNRNLNLQEIMSNYAFSIREEKISSELIFKECDENILLLMIKEFLKKINSNFELTKDSEEEKINTKFWNIYVEEYKKLEKNYEKKVHFFSNFFIKNFHNKVKSTVSTEFVKKNNYLINV